MSRCKDSSESGNPFEDQFLRSLTARHPQSEPFHPMATVAASFSGISLRQV
jgi:hypothetical protein